MSSRADKDIRVLTEVAKIATEGREAYDHYIETFDVAALRSTLHRIVAGANVLLSELDDH